MDQLRSCAATRPLCFQKTGGLSFSTACSAGLPAATASGLACVKLDVPVHHYGYVLSPDTNDARRRRYRRLVEMKHADDPGDAAALLELAAVRLEDGNRPEAERLLETLSTAERSLRPVSRGCVLLARLRRGEFFVDGLDQLLIGVGLVGFGGVANDDGAHFAVLSLEKIK